MRTHLTRRHTVARPLRGARTHRLAPLVAGQCFDIDVSREAGGWLIDIPEIGASTHATRRVAVELAARECIAAHTGIPIGYIAIRVRD